MARTISDILVDVVTQAERIENEVTLQSNKITQIREILQDKSGGKPLGDKFAAYVARTITEVTAEELASTVVLGDYAFAGCDNLVNITIPKNVKSLGDYALDCGGSDNKTTFTFQSSTPPTITSTTFSVEKVDTIWVPAGALGSYQADLDWKYVWGFLKESKKEASEGLSYSYDSTTNSYWVTGIGTCTDTELIIPKVYNNGIDGEHPVDTIGGYAFNNCDSLTSVVIGDNVTTIHTQVFYRCEGLRSVIIPDSVTNIGYMAFAYCESLKSVYYKGSSSDWSSISFGNYVWRSTNATRYYYSEVPPTTSGNYWRYVNGVPAAWVLGDDTILTFGLTTDVSGSNCYLVSDCNDSKISQGTTLIIPSKYNGVDGEYPVSIIDKSAFRDCSNLASVIIPDNVTSIGWGAFYGCDNLTSIEIPSNVTTIGDLAFYDCKKLTSIVIPDSITSIGKQVCYRCYDLTSVTIGNSVTSIGDEAFSGCYKLVEVINKSPSITVEKGSTSNSYLGYYALEVFNSTDTYVNKFTNDSGYVVYNDGDEKVLCAYQGAGAYLTLPAYVTSIHDRAFYSNTLLTSIEIPDSVKSIGSSVFAYCNLTRVVIPDSVTSIGSYAFSFCYSLGSIVIGNGVTSIGEYACIYCYGLTKVYYKGNSSDWSNISIHSNNSGITDATRYYYSENQPTTSGNYWHYVDGVPTVWA